VPSWLLLFEVRCGLLLLPSGDAGWCFFPAFVILLLLLLLLHVVVPDAHLATLWVEQTDHPQA
jgi:hypothetical protein